MPNFISLILSEIADKLNCTLINAYYFNLKLNVHNNSPSTCIASFTSSTYSHVKMIHTLFKVENILKGSLDSIPSPSVKIQTMGRKVCLRCKGKMFPANFPAHNLNCHCRWRWRDFKIFSTLHSLLYFHLT